VKLLSLPACQSGYWDGLENRVRKDV